MKRTAMKKQQGVVLIWALAILLVLTILGISSVKKANMGTKIAGNSMASMMVYQGAESALAKISNTKFAADTSSLPLGQKYSVAASVLPKESVNGGNLVSTGTVMVMSRNEDCPLTNIALSSQIKCDIFRFEVESRLQGTGAKTEHVQGNAKPIAITNAYSN